MFWYLVICILMLYPCLLIIAGDQAAKNTRSLALKVSCGILLFFMACRGVSVGVDTKYYCYVFQQFKRIPLSSVFTAVTFATESQTWSFDFEPGYRLWNKLLSYLSGSPQFITVCNSILVIVLLYFWIKKDSPDYMLSIWLYITLGIFQTEMNVSRNAIAILIAYHAVGCIKEKRPVKYIAMILLSMSFHSSMFVFLPLYWLLDKPLFNGKRMLIAIGAAVFIGCNISVIGPYIAGYIPFGLGRYFMSSSIELESILVGVFYGGLFLMVQLLMRHSERRLAENTLTTGHTMLALNLCCFGINIGFLMASRLAALFGPYLIVYIPQLINCIASQKRKNQATALVALVCGCQYVLRLLINNIGGTMPYQFFW